MKSIKDKMKVVSYENPESILKRTSIDFKNLPNQFDGFNKCVQEEVFALALKIISHCADNKYQYDERNQWCHQAASQIVKNNQAWFN